MSTDHESDELIAGFRAEADQLLGDMEDCLLRIEADGIDAETLNALFRSVHTIKGTAGLFALSAVVAFTHRVETLMDLLRDGSLSWDPATGPLLMGCRDHLLALLDAELNQRPVDADAQARGAMLSAALDERVAGVQGGTAAGHAGHDAGVAASSAADAAVCDGGWRIDVAFGPETFRDGFDPLSLLQHLGTLGRVSDLQARVVDAGPFETLDPEVCRMAFRLDLLGDCPRAALDDAFLFLAESCRIVIEPLAATSQVAEPAPQAMQAPQARPADPVQAAAAIVAELRSAAGADDPARPAAQSSGTGRGEAGGDASRTDDQRMLRIPARKLDELIDLVGELVIAGSANVAGAREHGVKTLTASASRVNALAESIRDRALALRMVPVGDTFARFRRIVRELAGRLGKQVALELRGGDTELDKSMIEALNDPLVHIVRNALDHGVELPEQRALAGKPAQATLVLSAHHDAGSVVIEVIDDGAGLNRARILAKAAERGLVAADAELDDEALAELVFAPGFSTASQVTDLSGRGVGMDVVRRSIESLRGTVRLIPRPGGGTIVQMRVPLTLAIIDGFHARVGGLPFVLPLESVIECVSGRRLPALRPGRVTDTIALRGQPLPILHLRALFDLAGETPERPSVVVVRAGTRRLGLVFDHLAGEGQTVIKPLGDLFGDAEGISGSSVLGTGEVALILDTPALARIAVAHESAGPAPADPSTSSPRPSSVSHAAEA